MKLDGRGERVKRKSRTGFILDLNHQEGSNTLIGKKEGGGEEVEKNEPRE